MRKKRSRTFACLSMSAAMLITPVSAVSAKESSADTNAVSPSAETVQIGSDVWDTPFIPDEALRIKGVENSSVVLNETTGDGTWKYLFDIPDYTRPGGVPAPDAENQDFDFSKWSEMNWQNIKVPGEPLMQGFDIQTNNEYYYQRQITIPEDYEGCRILVRFDGVYSNARVWINGTYVTTHIGGFTTWDADITPYAAPGETVTLTVGVADIYASTKGIWNPEGKDVSNPSNASEYAHHNIGGINRDVALVALPSSCIARTYVETDFDESFTDATLSVTAQLGMSADKAVLKAELYDGEQLVTSGEMNFSNPAPATSSALAISDALKLSLPVSSPKKWDAEHPNLYTLRTTLLVNGEEIQVNEEKVGFSEIHYSGKDGTDRNKVYVNGKEVKLRGTCRHDVSDDLGRSMTREEAYAEIEAYKKANINYIRTSHYPPSEHLLDACDEMGIYIEEETAVCFQGYGSRYESTVHSKYEDYLPQFTEMIERDRNRPSVLIWSLGNESNYTHVNNQSGGNAFGDEREYLRDVDNTRPTKFSFPDTGEPWGFVDIYSKHYAWVEGGLGSADKPVLHDEYAHVSCYNLDELQRDVNVRNFWGESLKRGWENMFMTDGALGGAIWGGIDDMFYIPEGTNERWIRHSDGQTAGYGEWGSVLDAYLREKPEAYLTKKAYSPVRLNEEDCTLNNDVLMVPVKNWFDHTNMNELEVEYTVGNEIKRIPVAQSIAPHGEGTIEIPCISPADDVVNLKFYTYDGWMVDEFNIELASSSFKFTDASEAAPSVEEKSGKTIVAGDNFSITFDHTSGLIESGMYGGQELLCGGPYLHTTGLEIGRWLPDETEAVSVKTEGQFALATLKGKYETGPAVTFTLKISSNGIIDTQYTLTSAPSRTGGMREVGISFDINEDLDSVSWQRDGLYSAYPQDHIGRNAGTALKVREGSDKMPDQYGVEPKWSWKDDMKNYFVYPTEDPNNGLVTNDFKTMRENVYVYTVNYGDENTPHISVEDPTASAAARVDVSYLKDYLDDRDASIKYSGEWYTYETNADFSGTEMYSTKPGDTCELTFEGTGVRFIGSKQDNTGSVNVYVDGEFKGEIDTHSNLGSDLKQSVIYSIEDLEFGTHTITLETAGGLADCVVVDAFDVIVPNENAETEKAKLIVNNQWYYPNLSWGNYCGNEGTLYKGSTGRAVIRLSDKVDVQKISEPSIKNARVSQAGDTLNLSFDLLHADDSLQTKIEWYHMPSGDPESKKQRIEEAQGTSISSKGLEGHDVFAIISLERDGKTVASEKSAFYTVSAETLVWHDIVDDSASFVFTGLNGTDYLTDRDKAWTQNAYNKTVTYLMDTPDPAAVTFVFTGNEIRWIGAKENNQGIAKITVDDEEPVEIDLFGEGITTGNQVNEILFSKSWDSVGEHTIKIERTGRKNDKSTGANVSLDAFIVVDRTKEGHLFSSAINAAALRMQSEMHRMSQTLLQQD